MIAIHHRNGSYSDKWIEYCEIHDIRYKIVNCFDSDIIQQLKKCDALMWHWSHSDYKAKLFAVQLIRSVEELGIKVFPNSSTAWHYDDKLGQKYLLEAIDASLVSTYVFYDREDALTWIENADFPKVFKTRNGAGSHNVRLIKNKREAKKIIKKSFGSGIRSFRKFEKVKDKLWRFRRDKNLKSFLILCKHALKGFLPYYFAPDHSIEKNYVYFQEFIPECDYDYRLKVIGNRCWGKIRYNRYNDFRASSSGLSDYDPSKIPKKLVNLSFRIAKKLKLQSVAYDFLIKKNTVYLIEITYAYGYKDQELKGYWNINGEWINGEFVPEYCMIEDLLSDTNEGRGKINAR